MIENEIRKLNLEDMKSDINNKMATIVNDLKKNQQQVVKEENRSLR